MREKDRDRERYLKSKDELGSQESCLLGNYSWAGNNMELHEKWRKNEGIAGYNKDYDFVDGPDVSFGMQQTTEKMRKKPSNH